MSLTPLSRPTLAAAALMLMTAGIHVFAGAPEVHVPIQASDLPVTLRAISSVLWHAVTVQLLAFTAVLLWVARYPNRAASLLIATICLCYTALFLWIGTTMMHSPWPLPQWLLFTPLAALTLWGAKPTTLA
jgi:hypothetical protein